MECVHYRVNSTREGFHEHRGRETQLVTRSPLVTRLGVWRVAYARRKPTKLIQQFDKIFGLLPIIDSVEQPNVAVSAHAGELHHVELFTQPRERLCAAVVEVQRRATWRVLGRVVEVQRPKASVRAVVPVAAVHTPATSREQTQQ